MKVLFVTHSSLVGGAERALLDELAALPGSVSPTVASPPGPLAEILRTDGVDVLEFSGFAAGLRPQPRYSLPALREIRAAGQELAGIINGVRPDVVHANSLRAGLIAAVSKRSQSVPTVIHVHDVLPDSRAASAVRLVTRSSADAVIAISEYVAEKFAGTAARSNIHVLHNPLDTELFDPDVISQADARAQLGVDDAAELIGIVAQITPWKDQELAIRALGALHDERPNARLLVIGEAKFVGRTVRHDNLAYLARLRALVRELGLEDRVEFWGERLDLPRIMRALDVLVSPSWEEPFGRALIEAMAMQTAVAATSVGGPPEYIENNVDGILLPPGDVVRWATAIDHLLGHPDIRQSLGQRASPKVRTLFERHQYTLRVVDLYEQVRQTFRAAPPRGRRRGTRPGPTEEGTRCAQSRPLRVLFVEYSGEISGAQRSFLELASSLHESQEVRLACPVGPLARAAQAVGIPVEPIPESQLTFKFKLFRTAREATRAIAARRALASHIRRLQPDVIHANSVRAGLLAAGIRTKPPVITHCRDLLPPGLAAAAVRQIILARSSTVIAISREVARRLAGEDWEKRNVVVIDNPVNTARFDPTRVDRQEARQRLGVYGSPVLGMIAQITPWKGQVRALWVLDQVRLSCPDAQLLIVGEAKFVKAVTTYDNRAYEQTLHHVVDELGLQSAVRFLGEREDVERVIAALDVVLVPSTEEPFGRSVIEAMAMGVPVIATNRGGPAEIIRSGVDGVVLDPDEITSWARAVVSLIAGKSDQVPALNSRNYVCERFGPARHAAEMIAVYKKLAGGDDRRVARRWRPLRFGLSGRH